MTFDKPKQFISLKNTDDHIMSHEQDNRKLIHILQQFVLNRDSEDLRQEIYEFMIMSVIYHNNPERGLEKHEISSMIEKDFQLSGIPPLQIDEAISRLATKQDIKKIKNFFILSEKKRKKLETTNTDICSLENAVYTELKTKIQSILPDKLHPQIDSLIENLHGILGKLFAKYGIEAAKIYVDKNCAKNMKDLQNFSFSEMYNKDILKSIPEAYHNELDILFYDFFSNPSPEVSKFLFSTARSFVLVQILNADPNLQEMLKLSWSKKRIYLDTNVIINLLFGGSNRAEATRILIENTSKLQVKLLISKKTISEFMNWLELRKKKYAGFRFPSKNLAEALGEVREEDPFFTIYSETLKNNSGTNMGKFCKQYEHPDILLENKYAVTIEPVVKSIEESPNIKELKNRISIEAIRPKSDAVAEHDAYSILRVRQLRSSSSSDELGPSTWFLTVDSTLGRAEQEFFNDTKIPSSITVDIWFQIISNFISPSANIEQTSIAFTKLIGSYFNSHKRSIEDYLNFVDVLTNESEYSIKQLKKIVGDDYIAEKLRKRHDKLDSGEKPSDEELRSIVADIQKTAKTELDKTIEELKTTQKQEIAKIKVEHTNEIEKISKKIDSLIQKNKRMKTGVIFTSITISVGIISYLLDNTLFKDYFTKIDYKTIIPLFFNFLITAGDSSVTYYSTIAGIEADQGTLVFNLPSPECVLPSSGDWIISSSCTLTSSATAPTNAFIQPNVSLTIPNGVKLTFNFGYSLFTGPGGQLYDQDGRIIVFP